MIGATNIGTFNTIQCKLADKLVHIRMYARHAVRQKP